MLPPLPEAFLNRLNRLGSTIKKQIIDSCWDGTQFLLAPKTIVIYGDQETVQEVIEELTSHGFCPEHVETFSEISVSLYKIDIAGRSLADLLCYKTGLIYSQERSSFSFVSAVCESLKKQRGPNRVLDMCAAPGGKTLLLARAFASSAKLFIANEPVSARRNALIENLRRCGAPFNTQVTSYYQNQIPEEWLELFDLILIDAPCSGEGLLRKSDELGLKFWNEERVHSSAALQRHILSDVSPCLGSRGLLIYSTCTFSQEENEDQIEALLSHSHLTQFPHESISLKDAHVGAQGIRFYPKKGECGEGFFGSVLRHQSDLPNNSGMTSEFGRHLWFNDASFFTREYYRDPKQWPQLMVMHADFFRNSKSLPIIEIKPTPSALRQWLLSDQTKTGSDHVTLWRHHVLSTEVRLKKDKTFQKHNVIFKNTSRTMKA